MQSLWMLVASLLFSVMSVCVKLASAQYSTSEIVCYRGLIGMLILGSLLRLHGGTLRTTMGASHFWRGLVGVAALWLWFFAIGQLPLAMAVTLNAMSPLWIAAMLFTVSLRKGRNLPDWRLVLAILMGFAGVILLLQPSIHASQWVGGVLALISGVLAALAYMQVRDMGLRGEPEYRVVFYFCLTCAVAGMAGTWLLPGHPDQISWHSHDLRGSVLLLAIGVTAVAAQMAMTRAYRLGNTLLVANLQYLGIVFSSIWDLLIWNDPLSGLSWIGILVILGSGSLASFYNYRQQQAARR